jgi:hypothetical protein
MKSSPGDARRWSFHMNIYYSGNFTTVIRPYPAGHRLSNFDLADEFVFTEFGGEVLLQLAGLIDIEFHQIPPRWKLF